MSDTNASQIVYRGMTRALLDDAYNNTKAVADSPQWLVEWTHRSQESRRRSDAVLGSAYGPRERQRFDYFPSGRTGAPLFVFIHGGYWVRNAIGMFYPFVAEKQVELVGVEAGGRSYAFGEHAARLQGGAPGVLHGAYSYLLQDEHGQVSPTHSISAGLDYALIGPEHAYLNDQKRATYVAASDKAALEAARMLARTEGIIPALESSHAIAEAIRRAPSSKGKVFVVNVSGRGDKDTDIYRENMPELDQQ